MTLAQMAAATPTRSTVSPVVDWGSAERRLTREVSVLMGDENGTYPSGNSLLVRGEGETVIIDPSVTVVAKGGAPVAVDAVINSHSHEDHVAGNGFFADARVHVHDADLLGIHSVDGLMDVYGLEGQAREDFTRLVLDEFYYAPRPDAKGFRDGHVFDLGDMQVEAVHLPGHTRGHSGFRISGGVFFLSDIDLTGFGPYYGDAWSDLEDFEASLARVRDEEADYYVTFHHKGVIEGRANFLEMVDAFGAVIDRRHRAMLEFLAEPRTIDDLTAHRFVYRPHVQHVFTDSVERRSATLHIERMLRRGEALEVEPGRYQRA
jgi:glyoxylase-like metal-dependent hydrolase (beta-lactamase superfamily II)